MQLSEIIKKRRSVMPVQYNQNPISKEILQQLLDAANYAPTHKKTEPWRFKVLQGQSQSDLGLFLAEKFKETAVVFSEFKYKKLQENPKKAGAIIAICMQRDPKERLPEWEEVASVAMAVQNMWLTATNLGLGAYWSSPSLIAHMHEFFDLNDGEKCLGFFYLGYYDLASPDRVPGDLKEKVTWL